MVEWPEGIPENVRSVIERIDPGYIKSVKVDADEKGRVQKVNVRREGMLAEQGGYPQPYSTNVEYTIEYDGDTARRVHLKAEFEGDAGYNALMEYSRFGTGQAPEETVDL